MKVGKAIFIQRRWKIKTICRITQNSSNLLRSILRIIIYLRDPVRAWKDKTPEDFKFSLKFPKVITHEKKLEDVVKPLSILFYSLEPLIEKTLTLLIQLPPFLSEKKGFNPLQGMIRHLDKRFRYSLEVRHSSWFNDNLYELLKENDISLVWSVRDKLQTHSIVTSDQVYIRFIGDRSISEKDFGKTV